MKYGTVCSGINAPAVAWNSLGWHEQFCAEIESFPCSVLAQRHPDVPNLKDITRYADWPDFGIELLAGGTPCQSFSLAGLRKGMDDPRGQLTRTFIEIAARYRPRWLVWENVPGVLSADGGEAFAGFLAGLCGRKVAIPKDGWGTFGIIPGIEQAYGLAYRVLDTQFVCVDTHPRACPQRRERVFVVGYLGGCWQRAAAVLLERESLCGHPAPRRKAGQGTAAGIAPSLTGSGRGVARPGDSRGQDPVVAVSTTIGCRGNRSHSELDGHGAHVVSHALTGVESDASEDGTGRGTPLVAIPEVCGTLSDGAHNGGGLNGQDASTVRILPVAFDTTQVTSKANRSSPKPGDPCHPLAAGQHPPAIAFTADDFKEGTFEECDAARPLTTSADRERSAPIVAFSAKDHGGDASVELSPTLRAGNPDESHANGGNPPAIAIQGTVIGRNDRSVPSGAGHSDKGEMFTLTKTDVHAVVHGFQPRIARNGRGDMGGVCAALQNQSGQTGKGDAAPHVAVFQQSSMEGRGTIGYDDSGVAKPSKTQQDGQMLHSGTAVRRLTPTECARLQGFPDDYLDVIHNGKPAADGPKYRALGNAMSVNVMRWIGQRIQIVDNLPPQKSI